jgi:hypothetical protein
VVFIVINMVSICTWAAEWGRVTNIAINGPTDHQLDGGIVRFCSGNLTTKVAATDVFFIQFIGVIWRCNLNFAYRFSPVISPVSKGRKPGISPQVHYLNANEGKGISKKIIPHFVARL